MAYSRAVFYIDLVNGSDAARTALASCNMTNSGGVVSVNKTAHGLVNGAVVTVPTGTYSGDWLVKWVDADNFTLHTAPATGIIEVTGTPVADETFVVGSQTFTFKASRSGAGEVTISSDVEVQARNICEAINTDILSVVKSVQADNTSLNYENNKVTVIAAAPGTTGNSITFTESSTGISISGSGTLSGGTNSTYTADRNSVSITPKGGMSWTDARISSPAVVPGDFIFGKQSPQPLGIGNAQFTNGSATITIQSLGSCSITDSGAAKARVAKSEHNLSTGCVVVITDSIDYNGEWVITVISSSTFDLDGSTYSNDRTGTIVLQLTKLIDDCESLWNAANGSTVARGTYFTPRRGSYQASIILPALSTINTLYAYLDITDTDFSKYTSISFWLYAACPGPSYAIAENSLKICLCSNDDGTGIVDEFIIPACGATPNPGPFSIIKNGGGYLGNNIKSIAVYSHTSLPNQSAGGGFYIDQILACNANILDFTTPVSKNSNGYWNGEPWLALDIINGNTLTIADASGVFYPNTSEIVPLFSRMSIRLYNGKFASYPTAGNSNLRTTICYGFNSNTICDGMFFHYYHLYNGYPNQKSFSNIYNIGISWARGTSYVRTIYPNGASYVNYYNTFVINSRSVFYLDNTAFNIALINFTQIGFGGSDYQTTAQYFSLLIKVFYYNSAVVVGFNQIIKNSDMFRLVQAANIYLNNTILRSTTEFANIDYYNAYVVSKNHDNVEGNNRIFTDNGQANWQTSIKHIDDVGSWLISIESSKRGLLYPFCLKVGEHLLEASTTYTFTARIKLAHATNVGARLVCKTQNGIAVSVSTTKAANTDWEDVNIQVTPSVTAVVEFCVESYYLLSTTDCTVYVGRTLLS